MREWFEAVLKFLKEHQWIYNYPNTHILANKVLDNFNKEWIPHLKDVTNEELNAIPLGATNPNWPVTLKGFLQKIQRLKCETKTSRVAHEQPSIPKCGVSVKKGHEIVALAAVVHEICKEQNIAFVVDVGAGLGYLSQLLHEHYHYSVLGIEGSLKNFHLALKNQRLASKSSVKYVHHFIAENSADAIETALRANFPGWNEHADKVCITGLHACADLSVTILEIFAKLDFATSLVIMPCCYHRLELQEAACNDKERFKNFPASRTLRALYNEMQCEVFLRRPFLRLACQQTSKGWTNLTESEHRLHSKACMFRAIVQEIAEGENLEVKRLKRKTGKFGPDSNPSIEDYVANLKRTHKLVSKNGTEPPNLEIDSDAFRSKIFQKWEAHRENCHLVEVLTAFQTSLQSICENVVLLDRVEYLREKGLQCDVYKVADDRISPRCHALVATKL